jgi:acyl dehydratase
MTTRLSSPKDLLALAGKQLGTSGWHDITQEQVNLFADATGDHQWIHVDPDRAKAGPFGGAIAHGYLTVSLALVLLADVLHIDDVKEVLNYGINKVRFPAPVPVGAKVRAGVTLALAGERAGGIEAIFELRYELEGTDRPPCVAELVYLYR